MNCLECLQPNHEENAAAAIVICHHCGARHCAGGIW